MHKGNATPNVQPTIAQAVAPALARVATRARPISTFWEECIMKPLRLLSLPLAILVAMAALAEAAEVTVDQAKDLVGAQVSTADDVPLGELVAVQPGPEGCAITVVKLHKRLEVQTSPLQVIGLQVDENGKLQVTDASHDLERLIGIPF